MDNQPQRKMTDEEVAHDVRQRIDAIVQFVEMIQRDSDWSDERSAREWALVRTKLQEAKMWAGKVLEQLGSELPAKYQDKGRLTGSDSSAGGETTQAEESSQVEEAEAPTHKDGQRVVRTKTSGDRVYLVDDNTNLRQWITNPQVLESLGFTLDNVVEVEESELLKYSMGPALYKVD